MSLLNSLSFARESRETPGSGMVIDRCRCAYWQVQLRIRVAAVERSAGGYPPACIWAARGATLKLKCCLRPGRGAMLCDRRFCSVAAAAVSARLGLRTY